MIAFHKQMTTRRDFIKKSALATAGAALAISNADAITRMTETSAPSFNINHAQTGDGHLHLRFFPYELKAAPHVHRGHLLTYHNARRTGGAHLRRHHGLRRGFHAAIPRTKRPDRNDLPQQGQHGTVHRSLPDGGHPQLHRQPLTGRHRRQGCRRHRAPRPRGQDHGADMVQDLGTRRKENTLDDVHHRHRHSRRGATKDGRVRGKVQHPQGETRPRQRQRYDQHHPLGDKACPSPSTSTRAGRTSTRPST